MGTIKWKDDRNLYEAMLASSLFFFKTKVQNKRGDLFLKSVLSLIMSGKAKDVQNLIDIYATRDLSIDESKIRSAIDNLKKEKILERSDNDDLCIDKVKKDEIDAYVKETQKELEQLVNDVYVNVEKVCPKATGSKQQIIANVKQCFEYYFSVSALSYFDIDDDKDVIDSEQIISLASDNLCSRNNELAQHIINSIGNIINSPSEKQRDVLEKIARIHVSAQLMNQDPLLSNFKITQIQGKKFVLDTDVVLHAITLNASKSKQYKLMIDALKKCRCVIYIPDEIINEVYDHGEASIKRYPFVSKLIGISDEDTPKNFNNVFVEGFHYSILNGSRSKEWRKYIGNYYNVEYGVSFTKEVMEDALGEGIEYSQLPAYDNYNLNDFENLYQLSLEETQKTEKALHRGEYKNDSIAHADAKIYLTIKNYNDSLQSKYGTRQAKGTLIKDCYFVTTSCRVHYCAKKLGLQSDILCRPQKLIAYLTESGLLDNKSVSFINLFDNPFVLYTEKLVHDDVDALLKAGIDLRDVNAVSMKYELQNEIHSLLTNTDVDDFKEFYDNVTSKGYKFEKEVAEVMDKSEANEQTIKQLMQQLKETQQQNEEKDKIIQQQSSTISRMRYLNGNSKKKSHAKNRRCR